MKKAQCPKSHFQDIQDRVTYMLLFPLNQRHIVCKSLPALSEQAPGYGYQPNWDGNPHLLAWLLSGRLFVTIVWRSSTVGISLPRSIKTRRTFRIRVGELGNSLQEPRFVNNNWTCRSSPCWAFGVFIVSGGQLDCDVITLCHSGGRRLRPMARPQYAVSLTQRWQKLTLYLRSAEFCILHDAGWYPLILREGYQIKLMNRSL